MEDISQVKANTPVTQAVTFERDILGIAIYALFGVFLVVGANFLILSGALLDLIIGVVVMFWGLSNLSKVYREAGSAINYKRASKEVNNLYLRKNLPVCPYLTSNLSGFTCQIEFNKPFDIADDLPRCHLESRFKAHWEEKAPEVFLKAQESVDRNLIAYLKVLGNVKYEPAIPLLLKILDTPSFTQKSYFIYENANNEEVDSLKRKYFDNFVEIDGSLPEEEQEEQENVSHEEFDNLVDGLLSTNLLALTDNTLSRTDDEDVESFKGKWKFYSSSIIKQFALVSLGLYEDPSTIPRFLKIYLESKDGKLVKIARKSLSNFDTELEKPILDILEDSSVSSNTKTDLLDMAGDIDSDVIFSKLKEIAESDDETLSYYAINSLARKGIKGIIFILSLLENQPTELKLDAGRSSLALTPELSFQAISEYLGDNENINEEFAQIVSSIVEEFDHTVIKKYFAALSESDKSTIESNFEKHNLFEALDYLLSR